MKLSDSVENLPFVGSSYTKKLETLGIKTINDLLHHIPHRYNDFTKVVKIKDIKPGEIVTVVGNISEVKNIYSKSKRMFQIAKLSDETGSISVVWFNQSYITRVFNQDDLVALSGKTSWFARNLSFFSPEYTKLESSKPQTQAGKIVAVYPETKGISSKWLSSKIKYALQNTKDINEFLDEKYLKKYKLLSISDALKKIHFPKKIKDFEDAKVRLSLNEFYILLKKSIERKETLQKYSKLKINVSQKEVKLIENKLPFKLTNSQKEVLDEIIKDLKGSQITNRLIQGDVGSGKTILAIIASYITYLNNYKTILLAPTQILAAQHFNSFKGILSKIDKNVKVSLMTSTKKGSTNSHIVIATHAIFKDKIENKNIGLLVVDEQHKFGVNQIDFLQKQNPNRLTMTATPIPRTIAQTIFADMNLSVVKNSPKNRKTVKTWLVKKEKRNPAYEWIKNEIKTNHSQAFIVCPLVEDSNHETLLDVKSVKKEFEHLKSVFKEFKLGLLHGKMKTNEKNDVLNKFKEGSIDMLVTTPVVEVGIDIPNATIMVIESADRFGLASLHQLRGRVGRGDKQSYCLLFTENDQEKTTERLDALTKYSSGFDLAEIDFKLRGAGQYLGIKQHGVGELKIANWSQTEIIQMAKDILKVD